jgi:hypothetical protein
VSQRWLTLLLQLFLPVPTTVDDYTLRISYPTLLKKSDYLLLEVLTNNKRAVALYGYPFASDTYGLLKLKLMGCVVAFIQDLHNISNVDAMLSRSDVAHLAHVGGVHAPMGGDRVFVSNTYNIFSTNAAGAQLQQLLGKKLPIMVAALPRELDKMRSSEKWLQYYRRLIGSSLDKKEFKRHNLWSSSQGNFLTSVVRLKP